DKRNAQDRPKTKHALPGHDSWVLVKTKLGRRFVHNTKTRESLWRVPQDVWPAVKEFEQWERAQREKDANAKWAEQELEKMRDKSKAGEHVVKILEPKVGDTGYDSDGSYEYIEVTDTERESEGEDHKNDAPTIANGQAAPVEEEVEDTEPVEFGEDDIAYQLAAMGQDYGLEPDEYGDEEDDQTEQEEGLAISDEDAKYLFRDLLDDYRISPFTPWDRLIADTSPNSILNDDRYTVLPTMRARKEVWDDWAREKAARIKDERAKMEQQDPRAPYLSFLAEHATPKLYWPEFKRKWKREPVMNERKMAEKDRERLYRDHVARLKLPETTRKADLINLLKSIPIPELNHSTSMNALPQQLLSHLHYISLPAPTRDSIVKAHSAGLPAAP
ncbi:hypothetical protein BAUCODRAFT_54323, partial [Baudoinia panamericana UAMH 10762]